jgi:hypothetical protein
MSTFFCDMLSCVGKGLAMCRSHVQRVLPKCLKVFIISDFNSEAERKGGPNPRNVQN